MKTRTFLSALLATAIGVNALPAMAQGNSQREQNREDILRRARQDDRREDRRDDRQDARRDQRDDRRDERRDDRQDARRMGYPHEHHYYHARGPEFRRGAPIPREFRHRQYVVVDYRHHRLPAPPRGYHWVQVGAEYVLIAIATGLIVNIILSH
jgi:Ni/Co efflux regulator RcnB